MTAAAQAPSPAPAPLPAPSHASRTTQRRLARDKHRREGKQAEAAPEAEFPDEKRRSLGLRGSVPSPSAVSSESLCPKHASSRTLSSKYSGPRAGLAGVGTGPGVAAEMGCPSLSRGAGHGALVKSRDLGAKEAHESEASTTPLLAAGP